ncbi:MAG: SET domain-containing protein-lysine N-methyltransferase [Acidobacteria bacterium]|nr:SET domain-containing protein-lysine N-methyltransferase [Acidobacteriota bacterium]
MKTPSYPRIVRRRSRLHGWGVFAIETIPKNTRIIDYAGEKITTRESHAREAAHQAHGHIWLFAINHRWVRDGEVGGSIARYINHGCKPNCYSRVVGDTIWICAARTVQPGMELSYRYYTGGKAGIACQCRPGCTTKL